MIKGAQHDQLYETQNPNPFQNGMRDILFMPGTFFSDRKKAPDIDAGKNQS